MSNAAIQQREITLRSTITKKLTMTAIFAALGVVLSYFNPFAYIDIAGVKPNPFAHLVNGITGVLLGPFYSILTAFLIAIIRYSAGIGSVLAFPGGISGAIVVGFVSLIIRKIGTSKVKYSALLEPIGTIFIGGTISNYIIPLGLYYMWFIFAVSCIIGSLMGFLILIVLERQNITYLNFK